VTRSAIAIVKRFCRENPAERLGYQKDGIADIRKNRWFQGFDWDGLQKRALAPPIVPKVKYWWLFLILRNNLMVKNFLI